MKAIILLLGLISIAANSRMCFAGLEEEKIQFQHLPKIEFWILDTPNVVEEVSKNSQLPSDEIIKGPEMLVAVHGPLR